MRVSLQGNGSGYKDDESVSERELPDLRKLAQRLRAVADREATTPVLIISDEIELSANFYAALSLNVAQAVARDVEIELISGHFGWLRGLRESRRERAIEKAVNALMTSEISSKHARIEGELRTSNGSHAVTVVKRLVVSRAAGETRPFILGIASDGVRLPSWSIGFRLTRYAQSLWDIQVIPVDVAA